MFGVGVGGSCLASIVATSTPDHAFPATALRVQAALGVPAGFGFDVAAACAGFVYALSLAESLIACGKAQGVLVIGAEVYSRILDWTDEVFEEFSGWFGGKTSPVHLFWHSFDLAVTRFNGQRAPPRAGAVAKGPAQPDADGLAVERGHDPDAVPELERLVELEDATEVGLAAPAHQLGEGFPAAGEMRMVSILADG